MDPKTIQADVKNYKIREGVLYKRSKFLKEWRERWIVLTTNFLYTFASKKMDELTDVIDLKEIKSYKSYLRKDEDMIPPGFKIRSADDMYYFCARNCNEKWSWIVSLERLMDYKYVGASNYNNVDFIKTRGFDSQIDFENGGAKVATLQMPKDKISPTKGATEAKQDVDKQAQKILKQLQEQQKQLEKQKEELDKKQATLASEQKKVEQKKQTQQTPPPKQNPPPQQESPKKVDDSDFRNSKVAQLKNMYENKMTETKDTIPKYDTSKYQDKKVEKKQDNIHLFRAKAVNSLFEEFRKETDYSFGLKYIIDFFVNVTADEKLGYSSFVIIEGKSNPNKKVFSQIFIELLSVSQDYQNCQNLMKFIEICVFQMPGLFDGEQIAKIQKKLKDFFNAVNNEQKLASIIKNMFIMHKLCRYERNDIYGRLDKLVKEVKKEQTRNWAKKLRDDL